MQPYTMKVCMRLPASEELQVGRVLAMKIDNGLIGYEGPVLVEEVDLVAGGMVDVTLRLASAEERPAPSPGRVPTKDWGTVQFDEPLRRIG